MKCEKNCKRRLSDCDPGSPGISVAKVMLSERCHNVGSFDLVDTRSSRLTMQQAVDFSFADGTEF